MNDNSYDLYIFACYMITFLLLGVSALITYLEHRTLIKTIRRTYQKINKGHS